MMNMNDARLFINALNAKKMIIQQVIIEAIIQMNY